MMMLLVPLLFLRLLPFNSIVYGVCILVVALVWAELCLKHRSPTQVIGGSDLSARTPRNQEEEHKVKFDTSIQNGNSFRSEAPDYRTYDSAIERFKDALRNDMNNGKKKDPYVRQTTS